RISLGSGARIEAAPLDSRFVTRAPRGRGARGSLVACAPAGMAQPRGGTVPPYRQMRSLFNDRHSLAYWGIVILMKNSTQEAFFSSRVAVEGWGFSRLPETRRVAGAGVGPRGAGPGAATSEPGAVPHLRGIGRLEASRGSRRAERAPRVDRQASDRSGEMKGYSVLRDGGPAAGTSGGSPAGAGSTPATREHPLGLGVAGVVAR